VSEKTCAACGESLPDKMFWGENRRPMTTCTPCRRKESRRRRYERERVRNLQKQKKSEIKAAMREQERLMKGTEVYAAITEINKVLSRIDHRLRKYAEKVSFCEATARTEQAIDHQWRRRSYFEEIKELLYEDARRGVDRPLEYYLSNTYLLHKHGFPVVVTDTDPREEYDDGEH